MDLKKKEFFNNLVILGFDKSSMSFNRNMFDVQNKKGFQIVTHFLFSKLNEICDNKYKMIWPLVDKSQELEFRKNCYAYLSEISKNDLGGIPFPYVRETLFQAPGGNDFYELYFAFSCYVLQKSILYFEDNQPLFHRPIVTKQNYENAKNVLHLAAIHNYKEFTKSQRFSLQTQKIIQAKTENFIDTYKKLKNQFTENKMLVEQELSFLREKWPIEFKDISSKNVQQYLEISSEKVAQVANTYSLLKDYFSEVTHCWNVVKSVLENSQKFVLNGELICDGLGSDKNNLEDIIKDGNLSIERFLSFYLESLHNYKKYVEELSVSYSSEFTERLENNLKVLERYQIELKSDSEKLETVYIPQVVKNINESAVVESSVVEEAMCFPPLMPVPAIPSSLSLTENLSEFETVDEAVQPGTKDAETSNFIAEKEESLKGKQQELFEEEQDEHNVHDPFDEELLEKTTMPITPDF